VILGLPCGDDQRALGGIATNFPGVVLFVLMPYQPRVVAQRANMQRQAQIGGGGGIVGLTVAQKAPLRCKSHAGHDNHDPSLVVFPESGRWCCFGAYNDGGDVFGFVMQVEGVPFPEAVRRLGGGQLSPPGATPPSPLKERGVEERVLTDAHYALLTTAVEVYHAALLSNPLALALRLQSRTGC